MWSEKSVIGNLMAWPFSLHLIGLIGSMVRASLYVARIKALCAKALVSSCACGAEKVDSARQAFIRMGETLDYLKSRSAERFLDHPFFAAHLGLANFMLFALLTKSPSQFYQTIYSLSMTSGQKRLGIWSLGSSHVCDYKHPVLWHILALPERL
jgi:hypothetical protein